MTSSRRHHLKVRTKPPVCPRWVLLIQLVTHCCLIVAVLQSLMLQIAANWIEQEKKDIEAAKEAYMAENCPTPDMNGDQAALMVRPWRAQNVLINAVNTTEHQGAITFLLYMVELYS